MVIGYIKKVLVWLNPKKCCLHSTLYFVTAKPGGVGEGGQGIGMAPRGLLRARVTIANYHQINCNTEGMDNGHGRCENHQKTRSSKGAQDQTITLGL